MTKYTVVWHDDAINNLAELLLEASDDAIVAATEIIREQLARDPASRGKELSEGLRVLAIYPLRVLFEVDDGGRMVKVMRVHRI